ncbi:unnamed protein product, partial [Didymodactylos carnosus]
YVIPPSENNAVFIMTNFIQTEQTRSVCQESPTTQEATCYNDEMCKKFVSFPQAHGRWTGRCLTVENDTSKGGLCEIEGWCPVEDKTNRVIDQVLNFTIFIKNFVEFPTFNVVTKNFVDDMTPCIERNEEERKLMLKYGGVILIEINWDCNFDFKSKHCLPVYSFARLDLHLKDEEFSLGFNFRYASKRQIYSYKEYRTLKKAYGIRLILSSMGTGRKFDLMTLTLNVGSICALFGIATFICDILLLYVCKHARFYRNQVRDKVDLRVISNVHTITSTSLIEPENNDLSIRTSLTRPLVIDSTDISN